MASKYTRREFMEMALKTSTVGLTFPFTLPDEVDEEIPEPVKAAGFVLPVTFPFVLGSDNVPKERLKDHRIFLPDVRSNAR